jgi:carboxypeptidase Taq
MSTGFQETFDTLLAHVRETTLLQTSADTLEWDERTGLPRAAGEYRAEQVTLLRGIVHGRRTDPRVGDWLEALAQWEEASDSTSDVGATVHRMREDYQRDCRLPQDLVEALSRATVRGQQTWDRARKEDRFDLFQPALDEVLKLKRQQASCLVSEDQTLYDALLDEYEPGAKSSDLQILFSSLRDNLVALIAEITSAPRQPKLEILMRDYPIAKQKELSRRAAALVGFDFNRGRLDETSHPFCTNLGPDDCRILTRYDNHWFPGGLFGTLHEAGHGMYDQGVRGQWYGLPPGTFVSLGIHESQSRMWENLVGRSRAFWDYLYPEVQQSFPTALADTSLADFHFALNSVQPSLIRVEADEATYNLHVIVRFELEQALISGDLQTSDLPQAWNDRYRNIVGLAPPSDADGVLQDVHWSAGLFGYFPTYSLGNLYAAQMFEAADRDLGGLADMFKAGEFQPLLQWLQKNVHHHGRNLHPSEILLRCTGSAPRSEPLITSLRTRYSELYGF